MPPKKRPNLKAKSDPLTDIRRSDVEELTATFGKMAAHERINHASVGAMIDTLEAVVSALGQSSLKLDVPEHGKLSLRDAYYAIRDDKLQALLVQMENRNPGMAAQIQALIDEARGTSQK